MKSISSSVTTGANILSNPWYFKYDKGSGQYDRRQMLSINYIYKLPIATKSTGLVKSLVGGWEIAGTIIDETGMPVHRARTSAYDHSRLGRRIHHSSEPIWQDEISQEACRMV